MKKLVIISGPDRVGKSTLSRKFEGVGYKPYHFSEPDKTAPGDIFTRYEECFPSDDEPLAVWDRSYLCGHILEVFRESVDPYLPRVMQMEYLLHRNEIKVHHIGIAVPWQTVAHHHIKELEEQNSGIQDWAMAGVLTKRMKEHRYYTEKMLEFYQHVTIFPATVLTSNEELDNALG